MSQFRDFYPGLNVQFPISRLILDGSKTIETRTYPLPKAYVEKEIILIETPGKKENFKARMIAIVVFGESFKYKSKRNFYLDQKSHHVSPSSQWRWQPEKPKWGWPVLSVRRLPVEQLAPSNRGIKFSKEIEVKS